MRALVPLLLLAACGSPAPRTCPATFSGNFSDRTATLSNCPRLERDPGGDWVLRFSVASPAGATTDKGTIDLGPDAQPTSLASGSTSSWSATAAREPGCVYTAGAQAIPTGSFELVLTSVDTANGEATGTLTLRQGVHAQPMTDCGAGDEEVLTLDF